MSLTEGESAVTAIIQSYVDNCKEGNAEALSQLFHPQALMSGYLAGQYMVTTPEPFFSAIAGSDSEKGDYIAEISQVQVSGRIATATLTEQGLLGMNFHNSFQLVEHEGRWQIVAKLFESS